MAINSYWRPGSGSYAVSPTWENSPLFNAMANNSDQGRKDYYGYWLGNQGYLNNDVKSDFARALQSRFDQGFNAARFENPEIKWTDYLNTWNGRVGDMAAATDPQSRGVNYRQYSGDARWIGRGW